MKEKKKNIGIFNIIFSNFENFLVPRVYDTISTKRLLSMNFLEGKKLLEFKNNSHSDRKTIALNMFKAWYYPFYKFGIIFMFVFLFIKI